MYHVESGSFDGLADHFLLVMTTDGCLHTPKHMFFQKGLSYLNRTLIFTGYGNTLRHSPRGLVSDLTLLGLLFLFNRVPIVKKDS